MHLEVFDCSFTYEVARKAAIILRTSVSLLVVSSNPGVSIKTTRRPSKLKAPATWTVFVQDRSPLLTPRLDPLTRLINCVDRGQAAERRPISTVIKQPRRHKRGKQLTVDFPVPVAPIILSDEES